MISVLVGAAPGGINISEKKQENREEISSHHEKKYPEFNENITLIFFF